MSSIINIKLLIYLTIIMIDIWDVTVNVLSDVLFELHYEIEFMNGKTSLYKVYKSK